MKSKSDTEKKAGGSCSSRALFAVGDLVCATALIHRVDLRSKIYPGGPVGKVISSWINRDTGTQIISIQVGDDRPICDLVVSDRLPLRNLSANMNIDDIKKEALSRLRELQHPDSYPEEAHPEADEILCQILDALGHGDVVEEFKKIKKWYA